MPSLTKTWTFNSDSEGWTDSGGAGLWINTQGNPAVGSIGGRVAGRNTGGANNVSWEISQSYESLGIPTGAEVYMVEYAFYHRCYEYNIVSIADWTFSLNSELMDSGSYTGISAWALVSGSLNVVQLSSDILSLNLGASLKCGNDRNASLASTFDTVSAIIHYNEATPDPPIITIIDFTSTKLSKIIGKNQITITFSSDKNLSEWEVRADGTGVSSGTLIASGGSLSANTDFTVTGDQLLSGDKTYRINVYGKSTEGVWSV